MRTANGTAKIWTVHSGGRVSFAFPNGLRAFHAVSLAGTNRKSPPFPMSPSRYGSAFNF